MSVDATENFERHRTRLRAVAHRMLGSAADAEDAVQETWLRWHRTGAAGIDNPGGWLTTALSHICLDMLRSRSGRREHPLGAHLPERLADPVAGPEEGAVLTESAGRALLVVLDRLTPAERVAFVLHDLFAVPFEDIATILDRSPNAARLLAGRARRRVTGGPEGERPQTAAQRRIVAAFLDAARSGDLDTLLALLDPEVAIAADGAASPTRTPVRLRGADIAARQAVTFARLSAYAEPILADGAPAALVAGSAGPFSVMLFTIPAAVITGIEVIADPNRLRVLEPALFPGALPQP
ncbi:sigma-70 family RNA polymerase sigma factor [Nocardia sp. alder85J]|uniref:sigma-70 family RNA polymerase sigma factor n=1 Tax=Nocardia sp. alder85J TaxID=2862949 RepID=UPI001CD56570|nr:sigma-70 family RNA polymerase sigma factor [Nocardia sp. alder85J]MCX4097580.1 sigma-70 family RNA polymerase sigma factor [Nocardia sp. alder85J]